MSCWGEKGLGSRCDMCDSFRYLRVFGVKAWCSMNSMFRASLEKLALLAVLRAFLGRLASCKEGLET